MLLLVSILPKIVALRKESVDRNGMEIDGVSYDVWVALRKESVDRNNVIRPAIDVFLGSLSARRAWIEMIASANFCRNRLSLSARRAWIEIDEQIEQESTPEVALRKESVDRNNDISQKKGSQPGRSPQGERG